jgi:glutaredoxin
VLAVLVALSACKGKKEAGGDADPPGDTTIVLKENSEGLLLTWIDERGDFHTELSPSGVPATSRDVVRVVDPNQDEGTHAGKIFLADMRNAGADGTYPVRTGTKAEFDAIAVARRQKIGPTLASAGPPLPSSEPGPAQAPPFGQAPDPPGGSPGVSGVSPDHGGVSPDRNARPVVIIYGASWCGPCHQAADYLKRKGVPFVLKDIEEDSGAAREMNAKLSKAGLRRGSIPVLDVRGKVIVGFNAHEVDEALGRAL